MRDNDPAEQEKQIKVSTLLTNAVIFHTTLDMMMVPRQPGRGGLGDQARGPGPALAVPDDADQPVRVYATDEIPITPEQYDAHLPDIDGCRAEHTSGSRWRPVGRADQEVRARPPHRHTVVSTAWARAR